MSWRTELLGRNALMKRLVQKLDEEGAKCRLISIQAQGGMGKTRLLRELQVAAQSPTRLVTFHDLALPRSRIPLSMEADIARAASANEGAFWAIKKAYDDTQKKSRTASVASILDAGSEAFATASSQINLTYVILIDTVDLPASASASLRRLLSTSLVHLNHVIVILAGRDSHQLALEMNRSYEIDLIDLPGLEVGPASKFFGGLGVDPALTTQLVGLAGGRPVLLGLAAEWIESGIPLPDDIISQAKDMAGDPEASEYRDRLTSKFEESLVVRLLDLRGEIDVPLLEMARTPFRYTTSLASRLHGLPIGAEDKNFEKVVKQFYVKRPSPDSVVLHDEMRALINRHVWPVVDPLGTERRHLDLKIAEWYSSELNRLPSQMVQPPHGRTAISPTQSPVSESELLLRAERQFFLLRHNPSYNAPKYLAELRHAIEVGSVDYVGLLIEMCRDLRSGMSTDNLVDFACLEAEWLRLIGRRNSSRETLEDVLNLEGIGSSSRLRALLALARAKKETGDAPAAESLVVEARKLARKLTRAERATVELADGERLLSLGLVAEALEEFRLVIRLLDGVDVPGVAAQAADRAAYASSVLGQRDQAEELAQSAIETRSRAGHLVSAAASRCTLASIYRDDSRFSAAVREYDRAIDYFYEAGDPYWQATALMERGLCHLLEYEEIRYDSKADRWITEEATARDSLLAAGNDLSASVKLCYVYNREELPKAIHELGHVYWEQGESGQTKKLWSESLEVSLSAGNLRYVLENLIGMCELDIEGRRYSEALRWREVINPYRERTRKSHALLWSRLRKLEAEAQFHLGQLESSLHGYSEAIPQLAQHGGWGRYKLEFELAAVGNLIQSLPNWQAQRWLVHLTKAWESRYRGLSEKRVELLAVALRSYMPSVDRESEV
jgi:tetratricopeptide (TPR) repeat protein